MTPQQIKANAPEGATHIDKAGDYWKVVSDDESYFIRLDCDNKWVRYIFKTSRAFRSHNLQPL